MKEQEDEHKTPLLLATTAYGATSLEHGNPYDPVEMLPFEVTMQIFSLLNTHDLLNVACVSKRWRQASEDHTVWREKCLRELTPTIPPAEILVDNRDYKLLFKTEWLIKKWKQSHMPRKPLMLAETQAKEEYRQLNFQFEEKLLDLREMVSYKFVFLLRLFNTPLIDYITFILWLLLIVFVSLKLDGVLGQNWKWSAAAFAIWPLALIFLGATITWWYFVVRKLMDKEFMQRCLFGWINVICCCFSDDTIEATLWFVSALFMALFPCTLCAYIDNLLPKTFLGSPWISMAPASIAVLLLSALFLRSAILKPGAVRGVKCSLVFMTLIVVSFFLLVAAKLQGLLPTWGIWKLMSPIWTLNGLSLLAAFTFCDPKFFLRDRWLKNGILLLFLVGLLLSPFAVSEVLFCLRISGSQKIRLYSFGMIPLFILVATSIVVIFVADLHLWQRIKHFWIVKRSFRFSLKEHWRTRSNSLLVLD